MKALFILDDPPYGTERCFNALRLAHGLLKKDPETQITIFLIAGAAGSGSDSGLLRATMSRP